MKQKILVCGSTGFIGRNIAEFFAKKDTFDIYGTYFRSRPLNNDNIHMIKADLTNKDDVNRAIKGMDIVIQAAAVTSGAKEILAKPYTHITDNVIMNALLFRAAYEYKISHVIYFSCMSVYQSSKSPVKETDLDLNKELYPAYFGAGWMKIYNEKQSEFYSRIGPTKYTLIRHSNIYGPYDKFDPERSHVFGATVTKVMSAEEGAKIVIWGQGKEKRDLLYVSDLVDFVEPTIDKQKSKFEIYNAGYGSSISVNDLVRKIIDLSGKNIGIEYDTTKPTINIEICPDITKARKVLGWIPKVSLDEGIRKTMNWHNANIDTYSNAVKAKK